MTKMIRSQWCWPLCVSGQRRVLRPIRRRSDLQSQVPDVPWLGRRPQPGMAKMMGIKPVSDPEIKKLTVQMVAAVKNGKGKMKPVAGLTDAQIKDAVTFYK
jgi:hypothetical protein